MKSSAPSFTGPEAPQAPSKQRISTTQTPTASAARANRYRLMDESAETCAKALANIDGAAPDRLARAINLPGGNFTGNIAPLGV
jgi:hypothetical protein